MGFRTVVMLNNDASDKWSKDPELGQKILRAMNYTGRKDDFYASNSRLGGYGQVVECVHADTQTLVRLDHYTGFEPLAHTSRTFGPSTDEDKIELLKRAAEELGFKLVKKAKKV